MKRFIILLFMIIIQIIIFSGCSIPTYPDTEKVLQNNEIIQTIDAEIDATISADMPSNQQSDDSNTSLDSNLCKIDEELLFSFQFVDSDKVLTIATSNTEDYLVCRMGTKDGIELEFPSDKTDSWDQFYYLWYTRGGGFQNRALNFGNLFFETDIYEYQVFWEYRAIGEDAEGEDIYESRVGLILKDKESIIEKGEENATTIVMEGDFNSTIGYLDKLLDTKIEKRWG